MRRYGRSPLTCIDGYMTRRSQMESARTHDFVNVLVECLRPAKLDAEDFQVADTGTVQRAIDPDYRKSAAERSCLCQVKQLGICLVSAANHYARGRSAASQHYVN
jgi:hypothetical protein